jgi:hypothetical protein
VKGPVIHAFEFWEFLRPYVPKGPRPSIQILARAYNQIRQAGRRRLFQVAFGLN